MRSFKRDDEDGNLTQSLLQEPIAQEVATEQEEEEDQTQETETLARKLWIESEKLWIIVGPSIISRLAEFAMNIVTEAFAGHLGDVELAAISIANTVLVGFIYGLLVSPIS